jgi:FAD/FMN-containing dehydrogenase
LIVESGCILARIQETAYDNGLYFPLSLGAEGSSQIGGNISTNAGGTNVLKYGMTRDLVMGLEVVLPDGSIYSELKGLRKDNTGYDLKQFFIGAEGTLGFITKICLKLFLAPFSHTVALVAVESPKQAIKLLKKAKQSFGESLCAFELMNSVGIKCVEDQMSNFKIPLESSYPWQILIDVENFDSTFESDEAITSFLERQLKESLILDATIAINNQQRNEFWQLRHGITESKKLSSTGIDHDISVPISKIPEVIEQSCKKLEQVLGKSDFYAYGHIGDGNLHITKSKPKTMDKVSFQMKEEELTRIVHQIAVDLGGSFSGEHGIGVKLKNELEYFSDPVKMKLLKTIKKAIDPRNIMNPNKLFD